MNIPTTAQLFDLSHTLARDLLEKTRFPFEALTKIKDFSKSLGEMLEARGYERYKKDVWISEEAKIHHSAIIEGPAVIGHGTELRPGAFIRGAVIIGDGAVIGNSTEIKNAIIFDNVQIPHYNYVGDSILGYKSHMGAGAIASNFKLDHSNVKIREENEVYETGLRKLGVMLGDFSEVGCGCVLNPGTVIGRNTMVYPLTYVRGIIPENSIVRNNGEIIKRI